jgi:hypothetical protein
LFGRTKQTNSISDVLFLTLLQTNIAALFV